MQSHVYNQSSQPTGTVDSLTDIQETTIKPLRSEVNKWLYRYNGVHTNLLVSWFDSSK